MKSKTHIAWLNLSRNKIGDEGLKILSSALIINWSLIALDVSSNRIQGYGFEALFKALQKNKTLVSLDISTKDFLEKNKISDSSIDELSLYLKAPNLLSYLYIGGTSLSN